jgi:hypothetical protein
MGAARHGSTRRVRKLDLPANGQIGMARSGPATEFAHPTAEGIYFDRIELQGISPKRLASFL